MLLKLAAVAVQTLTVLALQGSVASHAAAAALAGRLRLLSAFLVVL